MVSKGMLHLLGPAFTDEVVSASDRSTRFLRNLRSSVDRGWLAQMSYMSILPVGPGIEHSTGGLLTLNPVCFDLQNIVKLAQGMSVQRRGLDAGCVFCVPSCSEIPIVGAVPSRYTWRGRALTNGQYASRQCRLTRSTNPREWNTSTSMKAFRQEDAHTKLMIASAGVFLLTQAISKSSLAQNMQADRIEQVASEQSLADQILSLQDKVARREAALTQSYQRQNGRHESDATRPGHGNDGRHG